MQQLPWSTVASLLMLALPPLLAGGILWWAQKYFVRIVEWEKLRQADAAALKKDIDGIGARIAEVATHVQTALGKVDILERKQEGASRDCSDLHEAIGELRARDQARQQQIQENELKRLQELGAIREQLAEIKTIVNMRKENGK